MIAKNERTLCYAGGILSAMLANMPDGEGNEIHDWQIKRAVEAAKKLIEEVYRVD